MGEAVARDRGVPRTEPPPASRADDQQVAVPLGDLDEGLARAARGRWGHEVLTEGISSALLTSAAMAAVALLVALLLIRVRRSDPESLSGKAAAAGPGL